MRDRDSFYHRAIRTKVGEAMKAQQENVAADVKVPKALDDRFHESCHKRGIHLGFRTPI
jgi:hypothetical protein